MSPPTPSLAEAFALHQAGQVERAAAIYRALLQQAPHHVQALALLGAAAVQQGDFAAAEQYLRQSLALDPQQSAAQDNLGVALVKQGQLQAAAEAFAAALRIGPERAETRANLGTTLLKLGRPADAAAEFHRAISLRPQNAWFWFERGAALLALDRLTEAEDDLRQAIRLRPDYPEALNNLGNALHRQGRLPEAQQTFHQALALRPGYPTARCNLGVALIELGELEQAQAIFQGLLAENPSFDRAHNNLGLTALKCGRLNEAQESFAAALALTPEYPEAHRNRAVAWLMAGDFARGWPEFLWRWKCRDYPPHGYQLPLWDGAPLDGATILLHAEQGLGDTLQLIRFAPLVQQRGARFVLHCPPPLLPLLSRSPGIDALVSQDEPPPAASCRAALMDLPALLGTTLDSLPAEVPYLFTDARLVDHWRSRLSAESGFHVGLNWQGNPRYRGDRERSIPLAHFAPLAALPGVRLWSLQKQHGLEQLAAARFPVVDLGSQLDEQQGAFVETAAVMQALDLVVTSDTATAHLAGGLGVPVWLVLQYSPDWRWFWDTDHSPWYPTMRVFRQEARGDWAGALGRLAQALRALVVSRGIS